MKSNQTIPITKDYKVLVGCMTYNHSKYIVDALNGFAMQQTNFPYACIVMDDASTDGEPEVISDWLQKECGMERANIYNLELANVIVVPHRTNANCTFAIYLLKRNLYKEENLKFDLVKDWGEHGEYLALCEGDDYWTDPEKLQIQSDCLDTHPEVDMCAHSYYEDYSESSIEKKSRLKYYCKENCIIPVETVILEEGDLLATNSIVYRLSIEYSSPQFRRIMNYDYTLFIHGAIRGGIFYIHRYMSAYRRFIPGSWSEHLAQSRQMHIDFINNRNIMLDSLDKESDFMFHKIIQERKLLNILEITNNRNERLALVKKNSLLLKDLTPHQKAVILCKCTCPKLGHFIINTFRFFRLRIDFY